MVLHTLMIMSCPLIGEPRMNGMPTSFSRIRPAIDVIMNTIWMYYRSKYTEILNILERFTSYSYITSCLNGSCYKVSTEHNTQRDAGPHCRESRDNWQSWQERGTRFCTPSKHPNKTKFVNIDISKSGELVHKRPLHRDHFSDLLCVPIFFIPPVVPYFYQRTVSFIRV
jgi:hypothetical protein